MGVIIGMDPYKRSATIEVVDERGRVLDTGRFGTDKSGYAETLAAGRQYTDRIWAVEGLNGVGQHLAHRLVHDSETARHAGDIRRFADRDRFARDPAPLRPEPAVPGLEHAMEDWTVFFSPDRELRRADLGGR